MTNKEKIDNWMTLINAEPITEEILNSFEDKKYENGDIIKVGDIVLFGYFYDIDNDINKDDKSFDKKYFADVKKLKIIKFKSEHIGVLYDLYDDGINWNFNENNTHPILVKISKKKKFLSDLQESLSKGIPNAEIVDYNKQLLEKADEKDIVWKRSKEYGNMFNSNQVITYSGETIFNNIESEEPIINKNLNVLDNNISIINRLLDNNDIIIDLLLNNPTNTDLDYIENNINNKLMKTKNMIDNFLEKSLFVIESNNDFNKEIKK